VSAVDCDYLVQFLYARYFAVQNPCNQTSPIHFCLYGMTASPNGEGKGIPELIDNNAMKIWGGGVESIAPSSLKVDSLELSSQLLTPIALPPAEDPWCPLARRLRGPCNQSGRCGEYRIL
jgi:hypothetical protein